MPGVRWWVETAAEAIEVVGVAVIVVGVLWSTGSVAVAMRQGTTRNPFRLYRRYLGRAILLGLEFLVASDIIRTVSHAPALREVSILGLIVLIRTFLSFAIDVELEGRFPWQRQASRRLS